jgi:hypothetical protein
MGNLRGRRWSAGRHHTAVASGALAELFPDRNFEPFKLGKVTDDAGWTRGVVGNSTYELSDSAAMWG